MMECERSRTLDLPENVITYFRVYDQVSLAVLTVFAALFVVVGFGNLVWTKGGLAHIESMPQNSTMYRVDLNEADWTEIAALPTIGEVMARRLVSFRDLNGGIDSLDSLEQIRGMGPKTLKKIEPYIADFSHP